MIRNRFCPLNNRFAGGAMWHYRRKTGTAEYSASGVKSTVVSYSGV